nr:class I SAM-dependent methyltransferase [Pantoea sp. 201603H]
MGHKNNAGANAYTPFSLKLYDWWVLTISNRYAWRCPTETLLLTHFQQHMGAKHLDIGVGTGYYPAKTPQGSQDITLLDLNQDSLAAAQRRIGGQRVTASVRHDIFQPFPSELREQFDSVSLFYLLHCLSGSMVEKSLAIRHTAEALKSDGVLYGATILGTGVEHNSFGHKLMTIYNKKGIFSNRQDSSQTLKQVLAEHFHQVKITVHGTVALFCARQKK